MRGDNPGQNKQLEEEEKTLEFLFKGSKERRPKLVKFKNDFF